MPLFPNQICLLFDLSGPQVFLAALVLLLILMPLGWSIRKLSDVNYEDHYMDGSFIDEHHNY
jgi:hypothetical protein